MQIYVISEALSLFSYSQPFRCISKDQNTIQIRRQTNKVSVNNISLPGLKKFRICNKLSI